jgi:hypothetical protein
MRRSQIKARPQPGSRLPIRARHTCLQPGSFCYTGTMTDALLTSMKANFEDALARLQASVSDCHDDVWETDLWPDEVPAHAPPPGAVGGSAPWFLAYHALSCLDYDLTGDFERWEAPPPFDDNIWSWPKRVFSRDELLGYIDWCRDRARKTLGALDDDAAARPLPDTHRYKGTPYAVLLGNIPLHVVEHATQIRQFVTAADAKPQPRQ